MVVLALVSRGSAAWIQGKFPTWSRTESKSTSSFHAENAASRVARSALRSVYANRLQTDLPIDAELL